MVDEIVVFFLFPLMLSSKVQGRYYFPFWGAISEAHKHCYFYTQDNVQLNLTDVQ